MTTPLSVSPPPVARGLAGLGCAVLIGFGGALLSGSRPALSIGGTGSALLFDGTTDQSDLVSAVMGDLLQVAGLVGVPMIVIGAYLAVRLLRRAAWLDGSRLSVRGAVFTATADLAQADVVLRRGVLTAQDPGRGRRVRLPVRALPPYELRALAAATGNGRAAAALRAAAAASFEV